MLTSDTIKLAPPQILKVQETEVESEKEKENFAEKHCVTITFIVIGAIGAIIAALYWGFWYFLVGSVPEVFGFSRIWLDALAGLVYWPLFMINAVAIHDWCENYEFEADDYSLWGYVKCYPIIVVYLIVCAGSLAVSIPFSLLDGLAYYMFFIAIVYLCSFVHGAWDNLNLPGDGMCQQESS